jgi:hypothetical protein
VSTIVKKPPWPLDQLVTFELTRYREQLETAMAEIPRTEALHQVYTDRLAEVVSEQEARSVTTEVPTGWEVNA